MNDPIYVLMIGIPNEQVHKWVPSANDAFANISATLRLRILRYLASMPTSCTGLLGRTRYFMVVRGWFAC